METKVTRWIPILLRLLVGGLFVYTGIKKAIDPTAFFKAIENYQILPHAATVMVAFFLPYLELFSGMALIFKRLYAGALALLTGMMLIFIVAIISAWARGLDIDCGCFGSGDGPANYGWALARDFSIVAVLGFLGWRCDSK